MAARKQVALVTGATSGIGKGTATGIARTGAHVILLVRDLERGEAAMGDIEKAVPGAHLDLLLCDLSSQKSVRAAAADCLRKHKDLDLLVHCAGVFLPARTVTKDGVETTFAANYLGPFLLTNLLLPRLKDNAPSRIVVVASRYGGAKIDFDDLNFERRKFSYMKAVPASKLAQVLWVQQLAENLQGSGVVVNAVHPGLVARTKLLEETGGFFRWMTNTLGGTPEKGADTVVWLATAPETADVTGGFWISRKRAKTPGQGSNPTARKRLWEESEKLVENTFDIPQQSKGKTAKKK